MPICALLRPSPGLCVNSTGKRARQRDFKTVENPGDAERNNDEDVEASDRQGVKARRNVGLDDGFGPGRACLCGHRAR